MLKSPKDLRGLTCATDIGSKSRWKSGYFRGWDRGPKVYTGLRGRPPPVSHVGGRPEVSHVGARPGVSHVDTRPEVSHVGTRPEASDGGLGTQTLQSYFL